MSFPAFPQIMGSAPTPEQQINNLQNFVERLQAQVSNLEAERNTLRDSTSDTSNGLYSCGAVNRDENTRTEPNPFEHPRSGIGPGHRAMQATINQTVCQICDARINTFRGSESHETRLYSESFGRKSAKGLERPASQFSTSQLLSISAIEDPDMNGLGNQTQLTPDDDPPEYTEEDHREHEATLSGDGIMWTNEDHRLRFLSRFIYRAFEHFWNSEADALEARFERMPGEATAFDMQAFNAAEKIEQEYDVADCDEESNADSNQILLSEKAHYIGLLSAFVDGLYAAALNRYGLFHLNTLMTVHHSVAEELREDSTRED
ncbi:MAG: hypothetical protein Q9169_008317 [Polycauliona sp. 2 TL-2023]